jgi:hypothetical protein
MSTPQEVRDSEDWGCGWQGRSGIEVCKQRMRSIVDLYFAVAYFSFNPGCYDRYLGLKAIGWIGDRHKITRKSGSNKESEVRHT